jgi:hypothetical protein
MFYSNIDLLGLDFGLCSTYINGTQVTTEDIRVLSPTANITVKDFANVTLKTQIINKSRDGIYIKMGLDIATISFFNNYTHNVVLVVTRGNVVNSFTLAPGFTLQRRLAMGAYKYEVDYENGTMLYEKTISFSSTSPDKFMITLWGGESVSIRPPAYYVPNAVDYILVFMGIGLGIGIPVVIVVLARRLPKGSRSRTGSSSKGESRVKKNKSWIIRS